jgi:hypothetical protein
MAGVALSSCGDDGVSRSIPAAPTSASSLVSTSISMPSIPATEASVSTSLPVTSVSVAPPLEEEFTASCCEPTSNPVDGDVSISVCAPQTAQGQVSNMWIYTSTYSLDVDVIVQEAASASSIQTYTLELADVVGGERRLWTATAPADDAALGPGTTFACEVRAVKRRGDIIDPAAKDRVLFKTEAAKLCRDLTAEPGAQQALIAALRALPVPEADRAELDNAFDLWFEWEEAVRINGSVPDAAVKDASAMHGAFEANGILAQHTPECALHVPSGG